MGTKTIETLIDELIAREGGYVDHPADRGGPTRWGITEQVARAYGWQGDMRALPREDAAGIYWRRYWKNVHFDEIAARAPAIAAELFDCGVNSGQAFAVKLLQRCLNLFNRGGSDYPDMIVDGLVGQMTLHALDSFIQRRGRDEGLAVLLWLMRALRGTHFAQIAEADPSQEAFEYGWIARMVRSAA